MPAPGTRWCSAGTPGPRCWRSSPRGRCHVTLSQTVPVRAAIQGTIDELNATLNQWETIKKFTILTRDLTEARGELTTNLKVKRTVVEQHFTHHLDAMDP